MTATMVFRASLTGASVAEIVRGVVADARWGGAPEELRVDDRTRKPTADWLAAADGTHKVMAYWQAKQRYVAIDGAGVKISDRAFPRDVEAVLGVIRGVAFEVAVFQTMHLDWIAPPLLYSAPRISSDHFDLGWGCALRGAGHANLVSRRWVDQGMWRARHADGDLSLVQFHDLAADSATALAQAKPAHRRFEQGIVREEHEITHELRGAYVPGSREQRIMAIHRDVSEAEMLDACVARRFGRFPNPVDTVSYVFFDEPRARAHVHELWLRDLHCLAVIEGKDLRFDDTYAPPASAPAWGSRP